MVATSLPTDTSGWGSTGFIVVTVAGGTPAVDLPIRRPLIQMSCWAVNPGSQRPPWGKADQLAQVVIDACYASTGKTRDVTWTQGGQAVTARVLGAVAVSEPTRLYSDDASYAHVRVDVRLDWADKGG